MKKLILHIGTGKTGTSSIQNFLYHQKDELASKYGIFYPDLGLTKNAHFGEMIYAHYRLCGWAVQQDAGSLGRVCAELLQSACETAIISCEDFYHRLGREQIQNLKEVFQNFDVQVVCYIRRQDKYMESAWKQQVKVGAMRMPFEDFLKRHCDSQYLPEVHGNYYRMLRIWADVFGVDKLTIRIFDPVTWPNRDLIGDFVVAAKLPVSVASLPQPAITNIALPSELMRMLCKINQLKLIEPSQQEALVSWLLKVRKYGNQPLLSYSDRCAILHNYQESNLQLFKELCGRDRTHPCFTEAALVKPKGDDVVRVLPLENTALRTLMTAWTSGGGFDLQQQKASSMTLESLPYYLKQATPEEVNGLKALLKHMLWKDDAPEEKPWPPKLIEPLPFAVNTRPTDVVRLIKQAQERQQAMSIIRLGDGESAVVGYPEFTPIKEFEYFLKIFFGANKLDELQQQQFVRMVRQAVSAADVIGVTSGEAVTRFTIVRHFMSYFDLARSDTLITNLSLHRQLQEENLYGRLLEGQKEIGIITCRDVDQQLKDVFKIEQIAVYKIPEEANFAAKGTVVARHFPDRFEELRQTLKVNRPGMLFLVGAGPLGKVYCQWIKERGGIGLDIGSMFDAWAGLATRKFMRTEMGDLNSQYKLV